MVWVMVSRYGEFLLIVVMLLAATVGLAVAMGTASPEEELGPPESQYTVDVQLFVNDTANRTVVDYGNLTEDQRTEFDRAREATITQDARPALIEYAGVPYVIQREDRSYEVVVRVYD